MKTITKEIVLANFEKFHVYPGTNPNITQEEIAQQIVDAINAINSGDFDDVTEQED